MTLPSDPFELLPGAPELGPSARNQPMSPSAASSGLGAAPPLTPPLGGGEQKGDVEGAA